MSKIKNVDYGLTNALQVINPINIIARRAPTANDRNFEIGQVWIDKVNTAVYQLVGISGLVATWSTAPASNASTVTSLTVTTGDVHLTGVASNIVVDSGNLTLTVGNASIAGTLAAGATAITGALTVSTTAVISGAATITGAATLSSTLGLAGVLTAASDVSVGGNLTVTGTSVFTGAATFNGGYVVNDNAAVSITSTSNTAPAVTLQANGGALETVNVLSLQGTSTTSVNVASTSGGVTINGGKTAATGINLIANAAGGGLTGTLGSGGFLITSAGGPVTLNSGVGTVSISTDATINALNIGTGGAAKTMVLGNSSSTTSIALNTGTGASLNLGTNAIAHTVTIGNVTGATTVAINAGTAAGGAVNIATTANATAITLGNSTGTTPILLNAGSSGVGVGTNAIAHTVTLGNNTGASVVAINAGTAGAGGINIGTTANDVPIVIGNTTGASPVTLTAGSGNITAASTSGAVLLDGVTASHFTVTGAANLLLSSTAGAVVVQSGQVAANSIQLTTAGTGGITVNASSAAMIVHRAVNVDAAAGINAFTSTSLTTGVAGLFTSSGPTVDAIQTVGGGISVVPILNIVGASPQIVNARNGQVLFNDVIANGAYGTLTLTNSTITANSILLVNASCVTVNSAVQVVGIVPGAGSVALRIFNAGAASTATTITVNFWNMGEI